MPRYFFNVSGSDFVDDEGIDLPDVEAARREAIRAARELAGNPGARSIMATDENGVIVHEEPI
jgi:hypothetical protein